jgi:hypothetical protein
MEFKQIGPATVGELDAIIFNPIASIIIKIPEVETSSMDTKSASVSLDYQRLSFVTTVGLQMNPLL